MSIVIDCAQSNTEPGYAQVWCHNGKPVLIMGNSIKEHRDGTRYLWAADVATGKRVNAPIAELVPFNGASPTLLEVVRLVESWAKSGNGDAMWWLGDFYEFGSRETSANGGKALAYYLGAIRREPEWYDQATVERVLHDGCTLFRAVHPDGVEDETPTDTNGFLAKFREYREFVTHGHIYFPDQWDWEECVTIAEALS